MPRQQNNVLFSFMGVKAFLHFLLFSRLFTFLKLFFYFLNIFIIKQRHVTQSDNLILSCVSLLGFYFLSYIQNRSVMQQIIIQKAEAAIQYAGSYVILFSSRLRQSPAVPHSVSVVLGLHERFYHVLTFYKHFSERRCGEICTRSPVSWRNSSRRPSIRLLSHVLG